MRKILYFTFLLTLGIATNNCSSDSEVLASFETGNVTRKDLRDYYTVHGAEINEKNASIENQSRVLENVALQKIVFHDYKESGKIDENFMDKLIKLSKGQMLVSLYKQEFEKKKLRTTPMELVTMQMAVLRSDAESISEDFGNDLMEELNAVKNDKAIREIIQTKTVDISRRPIAGYLEPFCLNCGVDRLDDLLKEPLEKNDGKFYKAVDGNNVYILRIVKKISLHEKVLDRYLEENFEKFSEWAKEFQNTSNDEEAKQAAESYIRGSNQEKAQSYGDLYSKQFRKKLWEEELGRIRDESKIVLPEPPVLRSPNDINPKDWEEDKVLAELPNGEKIQYFSIRDDFREINSVIGKNNPSSPKEEIWDIFNFFYNNYLPAIYVENDAAFSEVLESDLYKTSIEFLRRSFAWSLFLQNIQEQKVDISEGDVKATYEAGKMFAYSQPDPKNPDKRNPIPYNQVKDRIRAELEGQKRKSFMDAQISQLKSEQNLKIAMESLKPGDI